MGLFLPVAGPVGPIIWREVNTPNVSYPVEFDPNLPEITTLPERIRANHTGLGELFCMRNVQADRKIRFQSSRRLKHAAMGVNRNRNAILFELDSRVQTGNL